MNEPALVSDQYFVKTAEGLDSHFYVDYYACQKAAMILKSLNHKLRRQLIELILEGKKCTVTELYIKLRIEQSVASQHLGILRRAGIVSTERNGKNVFYTFNHQRLEDINNFIKNLTSSD